MIIGAGQYYATANSSLCLAVHALSTDVVSCLVMVMRVVWYPEGISMYHSSNCGEGGGGAGSLDHICLDWGLSNTVMCWCAIIGS